MLLKRVASSVGAAKKSLLLLTCGAITLISLVAFDRTKLKLTSEISSLHNQVSNVAKRKFPMTVDDYLMEANKTSSTISSSSACKPHFPSTTPIKRIFFLHMRKAGGTIVRFYLKKVAQIYNITFDAREGSNTVEDNMDDTSTLYVTILREPVARTISHYKYDQRWDCSNLLNKSFVPSLTNTKSTMEEFLNYTCYKHPNHVKKLWTCATNCYTHWASGYYKPLSRPNLPCLYKKLRKNQVPILQQAHANLLKYHLIIIQEKLQDPQYVQQVEGMFGVKGLSHHAFAYCAENSQAANDKFPLKISKQTMQRIQSCSAPDSVLYQQLTTCPSFDFPTFDSSVFSSNS